jgi:hypothetical protein
MHSDWWEVQVQEWMSIFNGTFIYLIESYSNHIFTTQITCFAVAFSIFIWVFRLIKHAININVPKHVLRKPIQIYDYHIYLSYGTSVQKYYIFQLF